MGTSLRWRPFDSWSGTISTGLSKGEPALAPRFGSLGESSDGIQKWIILLYRYDTILMNLTLWGHTMTKDQRWALVLGTVVAAGVGFLVANADRHGGPLMVLTFIGVMTAIAILVLRD